VSTLINRLTLLGDIVYYSAILVLGVPASSVAHVWVGVS
jgi:hypothetical protein